MNLLSYLDLAHPWRSAGAGLALVAGLAAAGYGGMAGTPGQGSVLAMTAAVTTSAKVTIKTASVPGLGTVLVDGAGRTLYILTSETGAKSLVRPLTAAPIIGPRSARRAASDTRPEAARELR